jgi:hypothetical protein
VDDPNADVVLVVDEEKIRRLCSRMQHGVNKRKREKGKKGKYCFLLKIPSVLLFHFPPFPFFLLTLSVFDFFRLTAPVITVILV